MFNNNWRRINDLISGSVKSQNAYDIDRFCVEQAVVFPDKFLSENEISILKEDAYKNGLLLTSYIKVVAVLSRDRYLKEHNVSMGEKWISPRKRNKITSLAYACSSMIVGMPDPRIFILD